MATLCCIIVFNVVVFGNQWSLTTTAENTQEAVILNDIRNAFKLVTNDSQLLDHIIPEMYSSVMMKPNLTFAFKMPNNLYPEGFEMVKMQRNDFVEPIFPNVSSNNAIDQFTAVPNVKGSDVTDWSSFGLHGWSGSLSRPIPAVEQNHKDDWSQDIYPRDEILLDIKKNNFNGRVQNVKIISVGETPMTSELADNESVYIARVNDPFGYSVQWNLKNDTENATDEPRNKRDVVKLYSMIKCSTACDPLIFKGYGCFCGFGGHGIPADGIDRCCKIHDKCYEHSNCISYLEYFVPYVWKCYRGKPLCAIDHGEWGGLDSCAARLCQCDLVLSRCLRRYRCPLRRAVCRSSPSRRLQNLLFFD